MIYLLTPIQARQHIYIFYVVFAAIGFAIIALTIRAIIIAMNKKSPSKGNKLAKKRTNSKIINNIARIYKLDIQEKDFLLELIKLHNIPNLQINLNSESFTEKFFTELYTQINSNSDKLNDDELQKELSSLFTIRQKVENLKKSLFRLTSTTSLLEGSKLTFFSNSKEQFSTEILKNTKDYLILSIPKDIFKNDIKPPELSKIRLFYQTKSGIAYLIDVRIVRYQNETGKGEMVVSHSKNIQCYLRRQFKRIDMRSECEFCAVKVVSGGNGKNAEIKYIPMSQKYKGHLIEISAGGCSIQTELNVKKNQYTELIINIDGKSTDSIVGVIVDNVPDLKSNLFTLHILFTQIAIKTRNKIFTRVYEHRT